MTPQATGVPVVDALLVWGGAAAALAALGTLAWRLLRGARRLVRRVDHFFDDWGGEPARPGVAARPGVMERLGTIEQEVAAVKHEVFPNAGESLADAVHRIDRRTAWVDAAESGEQENG